MLVQYPSVVSERTVAEGGSEQDTCTSLPQFLADLAIIQLSHFQKITLFTCPRRAASAALRCQSMFTDRRAGPAARRSVSSSLACRPAGLLTSPEPKREGIDFTLAPKLTASAKLKKIVLGNRCRRSRKKRLFFGEAKLNPHIGPN